MTPTVDQMIELLDDKIVRTDQGSFIKVDDLKDLQRQLHEASVEDKQKVKPKTFAEARMQASRDPDLQPRPRPPTAPAFSGVKGVGAKEE